MSCFLNSKLNLEGSQKYFPMELSILYPKLTSDIKSVFVENVVFGRTLIVVSSAVLNYAAEF